MSAKELLIKEIEALDPNDLSRVRHYIYELRADEVKDNLKEALEMILEAGRELIAI
jgi:hypothetical protein